MIHNVDQITDAICTALIVLLFVCILGATAVDIYFARRCETCGCDLIHDELFECSDCAAHQYVTY